MNEPTGTVDRVSTKSRILQPVAAAWEDDRVSAVLGVAAALALLVAVVAAPSRIPHAMATTATPFLEVGLIVAIGWVAVRLGAIETLTSSWRRWGGATNVAVVLGLCVILAGFLNLDVAVGIAVPVALFASAEVGLDAGLLVIAVANVANATSFLLPTSNVTNLLVMGTAGAGGAVPCIDVAGVVAGHRCHARRARADRPATDAFHACLSDHDGLVAPSHRGRPRRDVPDRLGTACDLGERDHAARRLRPADADRFRARQRRRRSPERLGRTAGVVSVHGPRSLRCRSAPTCS
jgi:hypothetical protein